MSNSASREAAKAVVRRNTEEVQGKGNFHVFEELFANDFVDHTPQPTMTADKGLDVLGPTIRHSTPLSYDNGGSALVEQRAVESFEGLGPTSARLLNAEAFREGLRNRRARRVRGHHGG